MKNGNFLPSLWGEPIFTAAYLSNRSPHLALGGATPNFRMHNKEADFLGLRAIGARTFVHHDTYTRKLDDRAFEGKPCGFSQDSRVYRICNPAKGTVVDIRNVTLFGDASIQPAPGRHVRRLPLRGKRPLIHVSTGRTFNGGEHLRRRRLLLSHGAKGKDATPARGGTETQQNEHHLPRASHITLAPLLGLHRTTVLTAILHSFYRLVAVDRGFVSLVHELSFTVGIWSMFLFTILLNTEYCIMLLSTRVMSPECRVEL